ncbi:MAG: acyl-CoA thioesterase [Gemmatimonadales bacterium]
MTEPRHPLLDGFPVSMKIPVQWADMDAYEHVNNTIFFRYFESARIVYLERCGLTETREIDGVGAILHSTSCRFRLPLHYPDTVEVGARVTDIKPDRFTMEYRVVSLTHDAVAADGNGIIVAYDYGKSAKTEIPDRVRTAIQSIS